MESVEIHGVGGRGWDGKSFTISQIHHRLMFPPVASRTRDLEAKLIKKKNLTICKCPNSVCLESIVEKEEKLIN